MTVHVVRQGECLTTIAARYAMKSWRDLYDHPDNAPLKEQKRHPSILAPGDRVVVPDPPAHWVSCATEMRHKFAVACPPKKLRVFVRDHQEKPYEGKRFAVQIGDDVKTGTTAAGGLVEVDVPLTARAAHLRLWVVDGDDPEPDIDREVAIGDLDPLETVSGVQGRLLNLGYPLAVTGTVDDATLAAVRAYRAAKGLPEAQAATDGEGDTPDPIDDDLRSALRGAYEGG